MRKYLLLLFCIFYAHCVMAQEELDTHQVGDVIYSVFPPVDFNKLHGGTWVLMAGQDFTNTDLEDLNKTLNLPPNAVFKGVIDPTNSSDLFTKKLPDARGVFIRGMNYGRTDNLANPEVKTVGQYQNDTIKEHKHRFTQAYTEQTFSSHVHGFSGNSASPLLDGTTNPSLKTNKIRPETTGAISPNETFPNNVSLYIYIKINNQKYIDPNPKN